MAEFIARWFTQSKATGQSGAQYNQQYNAQSHAAAENTIARKTEVAGGPPQAKKIKPPTQTKFGGDASLLQSEAQLAKKALLGQ